MRPLVFSAVVLAACSVPATAPQESPDHQTARFDIPSAEMDVSHDFETPVGFIDSVNGDEYPDLMVGSWGGIGIHLNDGAGGFSDLPDIVLDGCHIGFRVVGDVNMDGFNDVSCGDWATGSFYYGTADGPEATPSHVFAGTNNFWGTGGDYNGDGYDDFILSGTYNLVLYYGGPDGIDPDAGITWTPAGRGGEVSTGDFNNDGYADMVFNHNYIFYTYYGSDLGLDTAAPTSHDPGDMLIREGVDTVGDFNGDGFDDLTAHWNVTAKVIYGTVDGLDWDGAMILAGASGHMGAEQAAGDFNGDGYADVAMNENWSSCGEGSCVQVFEGGAAGLPAEPSYTIDAVAAGNNDVRLAADYNMDGSDDLVVGSSGSIAIYDGPSVLPPPATLTVTGTCPGSLTFETAGMTAWGDVALVSSSDVGEELIPKGVCEGTNTGLSGAGLKLRAVLTADDAGSTTMSPTVSDAACTARVVAVDLATCAVTAAAGPF